MISSFPPAGLRGPRADLRIVLIVGAGVGGTGTATAETHSEHAGRFDSAILGRRACSRVRGALGRRLETGHRAPLNLFWPLSARSSFPLRVEPGKQTRGGIAYRLCAPVASAFHKQKQTTGVVGDVRKVVGEIRNVVC